MFNLLFFKDHSVTCVHLSRFSRVQLCVTPQKAAHEAPPSLGFSRQEHWSGLPCPSPVHEREKWKWSRSVVSDSSRPRGLQPTRLLHSWDFPGKRTGLGCHTCSKPSGWFSLINLSSVSLAPARNLEPQRNHFYSTLTFKTQATKLWIWDKLLKITKSQRWDGLAWWPRG